MMRVETEPYSDPLMDEFWKHVQYLHENAPPRMMLIVVVRLLREVAQLTSWAKEMQDKEWS